MIPAPEGADLEEIGSPTKGGQDVAAIEAKCSMGGADDFSESAADATVRVARITQRDKSQTGASWRLAKNLCSRLSTRYRW